MNCENCKYKKQFDKINSPAFQRLLKNLTEEKHSPVIISSQTGQDTMFESEKKILEKIERMEKFYNDYYGKV